MSARAPAVFHRVVAQAVRALALARAMRCEAVAELGDGVTVPIVALLQWEALSHDLLLCVHHRHTGRLMCRAFGWSPEADPRLGDRALIASDAAAFHRVLPQAIERLAAMQAMGCEFVAELGGGAPVPVVASLQWEAPTWSLALCVHHRHTGRLVCQAFGWSPELYPRSCDPDTLPAGVDREAL